MTDQGDQDLKSIQSLHDKRQLGGLLVIGYEIKREFILQLLRVGVPIVAVDNDLWADKLDCVVNEDYLGAVEMVDYLIGLGHREEQVSFVGHLVINRWIYAIRVTRTPGEGGHSIRRQLSANSRLVFFGIPEGERMAADILTTNQPRPRQLSLQLLTCLPSVH